VRPLDRKRITGRRAYDGDARRDERRERDDGGERTGYGVNPESASSTSSFTPIER
jgi:hypothetical protein